MFTLHDTISIVQVICLLISTFLSVYKAVKPQPTDKEDIEKRKVTKEHLLKGKILNENVNTFQKGYLNYHFIGDIHQKRYLIIVILVFEITENRQNTLFIIIMNINYINNK
ncbi:hypothetical protein J5Y03_06535 [Bacillus sp. RG28]|uniref:Uncharacterized protein n=1 Tax=Gottfriedia endophytica TaxID=2820819 RepID=A0A940SG97_9BACI|nr:hypothetical protein [Gottfriedia endophytica]MBP0724847.1 hypothetical protein [Gottfriedia endophytica]